MGMTVNSMRPFIAGIFIGFCLCSLFYKINIFEHMDWEWTSHLLNGARFGTIGKKNTIGSSTHDNEIQINSSVAIALEKQVRIVCWIMTRPVNSTIKINAIKNTWGKRCTKLLIFSSANNTETGTIGLPNTAEGRDWLWAKTKEAFKYIHKYHMRDGEWFLKADDDTYFIIENLRYLLSQYDPMKPLLFGYRIAIRPKSSRTPSYMSGGAGYILSLESVNRFVKLYENPLRCQQGHDGSEDLNLGKCLENIGVELVDTRDHLKLDRFLPFDPQFVVNVKKGGSDAEGAWYWDYSYYTHGLGLECCSDYAISFHYVTAKHMYEMEYLIYHLKPFGISANYKLPIRRTEKVPARHQPLVMNNSV